ncbi:MAG: hypothetical protein IPJ65_16745 [Archangiaceae bacterium]|nr:hypothetical protein [Archangiaceae bacterium]
MNPHVTNWTPGIIVLAVAVAGALLYLLNSRLGAASSKPRASAEDLEERYQALLAQLKEHAAAKHLLPEAAWQEEQTRLELAAAAVLRERSGAQHEAVKSQARAEKLAAAQAASPPSPLRWALIGGGVVAFFAVLGFVLTQQTKEREDGAGMTGANPGMQGGRPPMQKGPDPQVEVDRLRKLAEAHSEDIEVLADVSGQLIKLQAFNDAWPIVTRASGIDPYHVQTRIWRAVLDAVDGQALVAIDELEHLGDTYDGAYKARLYAGLISLEAEQPQRALKQLETYLVEAPASEQPPFIRMSVQQLKAQLAAQTPSPKAP